MAEIYTQTIKYFKLAIEEFLPVLKDLYKNSDNNTDKEEIGDLIEAYDDIGKKIDEYNLTLDDPNKYYNGEPDEIEIELSEKMVSNLAQLSYRMLSSWKARQARLQKKTYLTEENKEELHQINKRIWPLEALMKDKSYIVGKYAHLGPLKFPGEKSGNNSHIVDTLLKEIETAYDLAEQELLERKKLEELDKNMASEIGNLVADLNDEIFSLKFKKLTSAWENQLKSGFHNKKTAETKLEKWRKLLLEIREFEIGEKNPTREAIKTIKNRFESEGLFVETRSRGEDLNLIIGKRDGSPEKAHVFIDEKTGEIRVEDNQQEPIELVSKIEAILTLPNGKRIKTTREAIEELDK